MIRLLALLGALLVAAPGAAHQETVAYSRMVIREGGDIEYALKIPVQDLAEPLGKTGHAPLNGPEVRAAAELLFTHFQPLVGMTSGDQVCPVERAGIEVPEDDRLYGELRFVFHCPPGAAVTLDYRVFFDVDPGHVGMLEVEGAGGKARAEIISSRPRWHVDASQEGPPEVRHVDSTPALPAERPGPVRGAKSIVAAPVTDVERVENMERPAEPDVRRVSTVVKPPKVSRPTYGAWILIAVIGVVVLAVAVFATRAARRRPELRSR